MTAALSRSRVAGLLAGDAAPREFSAWPESARREADQAIADSRAAVARGFRQADLFRTDPYFKLLLNRDGMKALLAEMERSPAEVAPAGAPAPAGRVPSPLDQAGRLEEDPILGELAVGLLSSDDRVPDRARARMEAMLERITTRRTSHPDSPSLESFAQSIRLSLGEHVWKEGKLAEAARLWETVLEPMRRRPAGDRGRQAILAGFSSATRRISALYFENGLWERAAEYDAFCRAGNAEGRFIQCYESGLLALARNDVAAYREIASEAVERAPDTGDFGIFNALRTATLSPDSPVPPERLVETARRLVAKGGGDTWAGLYRIALGDALSRAGRDKEAIAAIAEERNTLNGKAVVARVHARAGRADQARRWLRALERDMEAEIGRGLTPMGALRPPQASATDVLRADILRREAYSLLGQAAPELRSLRLMRGIAFWRLADRQRAEAEFAAAVAAAPHPVAALIDRACALETLGLRDRADVDLAEAARRGPDDPRPWVVRGRVLAARGDGPGADAADARAAALGPGRLDPFLAAGWWVAGPYPDDMSQPQPLEEDPTRRGLSRANPQRRCAGDRLAWTRTVISGSGQSPAGRAVLSMRSRISAPIASARPSYA